MKFHDQPQTHFLKVLAQNPEFKDGNDLPIFTTVEVPNERLDDGPKGARFHVVDYDATRNIFITPENSDILFKRIKKTLESKKPAGIQKLIGDPQFHAYNCYAVAATTLLQFERSLGRSVSWGFSSDAPLLKIAPHAFSDMQAFYSRRDEGLAFGYFPIVEEKYGFTCLSYDVVVHEITHAILDGLRSEFMRPSYIDQLAFHEAFADIVAILSTLRSPETITHALGLGRKKTAKLSKFSAVELRETVLTGLADDLSTGGNKPLDHLARVRGEPLRNSAKIKPHKSVYKSPKYRGEPHRFGEVLVAVIINAYLEIWYARVKKLPTDESELVSVERAIEDGVKAADHLLNMCIRALDYLPPLNIQFPDYLIAILTSDRETAPDDSRYNYRRILWKSFRAYGVFQKCIECAFWRPPGKDKKQCRCPPPANKASTDGNNGNPDIIYGHGSHEDMQWDKERVYRFIWENFSALGLYKEAFTQVISVRPVRRQGPDGSPVRETIVEYTQRFRRCAKISRPSYSQSKNTF